MRSSSGYRQPMRFALGIVAAWLAIDLAVVLALVCWSKARERRARAQVAETLAAATAGIDQRAYLRTVDHDLDELWKELQK